MKDIYKMIGIYRITNIVNGITYIGKTGMNFGDRWDCHRAQLNGGYHDNPYLQNAWDKYGEGNFEFAVVESVEDPDMLNELERKYISEYRSRGLSYNLHDGGDGGYNLGKHLSDDTKRKIGQKNRENMTGRKAGTKTKEKMSATHRKRYEGWTDEDRSAWGRKTAEAASGYRWTDESRKNFSRLQRSSPNGARFTPDDIRDIRAKAANGARTKDLASEYNTTPSYISSIIHRRRWPDID